MRHRSIFAMRAARSLAITALWLIATAHAAVTPGGLRPGSHVSGPLYDAADLVGRVVLVEYWGAEAMPSVGQAVTVAW